MTDKDSVRIRIDIAGEQILLTVPFSRQDAVRDAEREVNDLYWLWRSRFPEKSDMELLAMLAFHFASHYADLRDMLNDTLDRMDSLARSLDRMNGKTDGNPDGPLSSGDQF